MKIKITGLFKIVYSIINMITTTPLEFFTSALADGQSSSSSF